MLIKGIFRRLTSGAALQERKTRSPRVAI